LPRGTQARKVILAPVCETGPVRRMRVLAVVVCLLASGCAAPAGAQEPGLAPSAAAASPTGETVCTISDSRAVELSGLVSTDNGYVAHNDSNFDPDLIKILFLDPACEVTRAVSYPSAARDPEDLAMAPDGTLWVADVGDNFTNPANSRRETIALWKLAPNGSSPVIHRLVYPDGPHDAEALVLDGAGSPVIVTKDPTAAAALYIPSAPLQPNAATGVALKKVGTFNPTSTGTSNFLGGIGQVVVTGGANAPDGKRVALRTYSDIYEWDVSGGDVVKAITTGVPRITAVPDEPQGEAVAYTRDGNSFLTVSDQPGSTDLLRYTPVRPRPASKKPDAATPASAKPLRYAVGSVGLLLAVIAAVGVFGLRRSRRARRRAAMAASAPIVARGRARVPRPPDPAA
jgi:hypothetical protein